MYSEFLKYVHEQGLFERKDKLLLGVSGGVDSVVLARIVDQLGNEFALAHCNFNLRGKDSDDDEKFVISLADELGVKCYLSSFQTENYAIENGISIEMAARDLRYDWFEKIRIENAFDHIVVGHHLDDVLETFILNLSRGTGIRGLSGIQPKAGNIVRPLLFASREQIEQYALNNDYSWREDASNSDVTIKRNKVRHEIIPILTALNPGFKSNLERTIDYLNDTKTIFLNTIDEVRERLVMTEHEWVKINRHELKELQPLKTYLFELLRPYSFNSEVVDDISRSLDSGSGTCFYSSTHRLVIDRDELIITQENQEDAALYYIEKTDKFITKPINLKITVDRYSESFTIPNSSDIAVMDFDKLRFPLVLRHWKQGEYFKPLGMNGFKKLSDFFIDEKLSIPEKEQTWILSSENKVAWIVGRRLDDRFKLDPETKLVLRVELLKS